ncbi:MAG: L-seryl-tRNA(Sec) selenium transferase [Clostridia bacterium]|nr:L-seryl-tRNA(Sec) selenium transferase [Clostridia bacterium]
MIREREKDRQNLLRRIPAVGVLVQEPGIRGLTEDYPQAVVVEVIGEVLGNLRKRIIEDGEFEPDLSSGGLLELVKAALGKRMQPKLRRVINATGVVLHTNLGRAILGRQAVEAINQVAGSFSNLELDLETGKRGSRYQHVEEILCRLTGAEAAMVVNNNAAAVLLTLSTLAKGKEVIVSRGELVEIGGSFRIPEVMAQSGARLVEVGATNKTHLRDYVNAITEETALLLKVHTSNYRIIGFTQSIEEGELVALGREKGLPVFHDLGSGVLVDFRNYGLRPEPRVQDSITAGVDLVSFSGDKLLGGPQAGVIVGKAQYIQQIRKNPLTRALRVDKFTLAALEATLQLYLDEKKAMEEIPTLRMLSYPLEELAKRAAALAEGIAAVAGDKLRATVQDGVSQVGGGALPEEDIPTKVVAITIEGSLPGLEDFLRGRPAPILARIQKEQLLLDLRTILPGEEEEIVAALGEYDSNN